MTDMTDQPHGDPPGEPQDPSGPQTQPAPLPRVAVPDGGGQEVRAEADALASRLVDDVAAYEVDPPPPAR